MRRSTALCCALLLFVTVFGASHYGWSQEVTASITGTITDQSGAAVTGATITATSQERGQIYTGVTNESGLYRIAQLPVGSYAIKVEKAGFALASVPPFVLTLNQVARIDLAMKVGQATETVEVSAGAPVLKTETTQVDTIINAATNDNLPLASRNYVQLTLLAPGAVSTDPSSFNNGNNTGGYGGRPLINGNREQANNFLLDGMDNNQVSDNLLGYTPAPDAIQEFNLITNNAPAEFGNFEGGIVNATINQARTPITAIFGSSSATMFSMPTAGRIIYSTRPFLKRRSAGTCSAEPWADRSSRTGCSSLLITRHSGLTSRVRQVRTRCIRQPSEAGILVPSVRAASIRPARVPTGTRMGM